MNRRIASAALLCAWLCASGAMLDVAQLAAWTRMFAGYAKTESLLAAAKETFDPAKPCGLCRVISKARDASERPCPAAPRPSVEKIVLICEKPAGFVSVRGTDTWPAIRSAVAAERCGEVPVPPPRGAGYSALS
jgi:hypothetical protein